MSTPRLRIVVAAVLVAVVCVVVGALALGGGSSTMLVPTELQVTSATTDPAPSTTSAVPPTSTAGRATTTSKPTTTKPGTTTKVTVAGTRDASGLLIVTPAQLPAEARRTLALIASGGPYPYDRDGIEFGNREGRLPKRANGYYREYTVVTPGSDDRGARRVITGASGERYFTGDHYETFVRVSTSGGS